ncbi:MAG: DUF5661 family protein [Chloroflexota bacterium]
MTYNKATTVSALHGPVNRPDGGARRFESWAGSVDDWSDEVVRAIAIAHSLGIDLARVQFTADEFAIGIQVEQEHARLTHLADEVGDDPKVAGMLALSHLRLQPDYYTQLTSPRSPGDPPFIPAERDDLGAD